MREHIHTLSATGMSKTVTTLSTPTYITTQGREKRRRQDSVNALKVDGQVLERCRIKVKDALHKHGIEQIEEGVVVCFAALLVELSQQILLFAYIIAQQIPIDQIVGKE